MEKERENAGVIRNEKGQFVKGVSGNPYGRPEGSGISIVTELKRKLNEVPEGEKSSYLQLLIQQILDKAIEEGDTQMIRDMIDRVDGKPTQRIENINDSEVNQALEILKDAIGKTDKTVSNRREAGGADTDAEKDIQGNSNERK